MACASPVDSGKSTEDLFAHYRIAESPGGLSIPQEGINDQRIRDILFDERTPPLSSLELSGNRIGTEGLKAILKSPKTSGLNFLNLSHNRLDDDSIKLLSESPILHQIEQLLLGGNRLSAESASTLAAAIEPHSRLRTLSLGDQSIGDKGAESLSKLKTVRTLSLESAEISATGASHLLAHTRAQTLVLKNNPLHQGTFNIENISSALEQADLRDCAIDSSTMRDLGKASGSESWTSLRLDNNPLGNDGIAELGKALWLKDLEKLTVHESGADLDVRKTLRELWGKRGGLKVEPR